LGKEIRKEEGKRKIKLTNGPHMLVADSIFHVFEPNRKRTDPIPQPNRK
jgi:hypothetical protein